jgi:diadenosine tetraphosphate (Ap4A) HIT family hydrolase
MACPLCEQLEVLKTGRHPRLVADLRRSYVVLGDNQGLPGWCVLIFKRHEEHLSDLSVDEQMALFREVAVVGNALRTGLGAARVNYECLGNQVAHLHWHVIPRYGNDPAPEKPVWGFDAAMLKGNVSEEQARETINRIRSVLGK